MSSQSFGRLSLHKISSSDDSRFSFSPVEFSRFKFGDDVVAQRFGVALAENFIHEHLSAPSIPAPELVVACSYQFIPTAACALRRHFVHHLNLWMISNHLAPVQQVKIHRHTTYQLDYGTLDADSRHRLISKDRFHIDRELVASKTILILDDIRITGSHEKRILRMFQDLGIQESLLFLYFAELVDSKIDPGIENCLNFYYVHSIFDLEDITREGHFAINARYVKYVLSYKHKDFCIFLGGQDEKFASLLLHMAIGNKYHMKSDYAANIAELTRRLYLGYPNDISKSIETLAGPQLVN